MRVRSVVRRDEHSVPRAHQIGLGPKLAFNYQVDDSRRVHRQADPRRGAVAGREAARVRGDGQAVRDGLSRRARRGGSPICRERRAAGWSPDGQWIAFVEWTRDGGQLYKVAAAGGRPVQLTTGNALYSQPAWSPDGKRIVALRSPAQTVSRVRRLRRGGGAGLGAGGGRQGDVHRQRVRQERRRTSRATPARIFLYSQGEGLVSIRWDGTDPRTHLRVTGRALPGAGTRRARRRASAVVAWRPAGDQALAQIANDLYVVPVPFTGEAPRSRSRTRQRPSSRRGG